MRPNTLTVNTQPHSLRPRVSHCAITQFSRITPASRSLPQVPDDCVRVIVNRERVGAGEIVYGESAVRDVFLQ